MTVKRHLQNCAFVHQSYFILKNFLEILLHTTYS